MFKKLFGPKFIPMPALFPDGMDMHTHILWGVDDGAHSLQQSMGIIRELKAAGLRGAYCTPHIMSRYPQNTPGYLKERFSKLCAEVANTPDVADFKLLLSAEYLLDDQFMSRLESGDLLTHADKHLLVELPQHYLPGIWKDMITAVHAAGYTPVLAHPERYGLILAPSDLEDLAAEGVKFQGNVGSLFGMYGKDIAARAKKWREANFYHWWGTDSHSTAMASRMQLTPAPAR